MRLGPLPLGTLRILLSLRLYSASEILRSRHRLEVSRVHTVTDAAEVIEIQPFWEQPHFCLIGESMGDDPAFSIPKEGIAGVVDPSRPKPASVRFVNFLPEALRSRSFLPRPFS